MPFWSWDEGTTPSTTAMTWIATSPAWVTSTTEAIPWVRYTSTATTTTSALGAGSLYWAQNDQQYAAQRGVQLYQAQLALAQQQEQYQYGLQRPVLGQLFTPFRPALVTHQEEARRDRELYLRAIEGHDEQEAARLLRLVERHEMLAADQRRVIEEQRQHHHEEVRRREVAKARARELLFEHLSPAQRETFDANGWFVVEGGKSKTQYRIRAVENMAANVDVLNSKGGRTHRLCAHARVGTVPLGDQLLAQKIMLELAEDDFLRTANRHAA